MTQIHDERARRRAEVIMKVSSGAISATEGSKQLRVSRKTYYEWEKRGLGALLASLKDGEPGRPQTALDPQKAALEQQVKQLRQELAVAQQTIEVKRLLDAYRQQQKQLQSGSASTGKKNRKPGKR
jgi:hypothetical protein